MAVTRRGLPIESITGAEALVESCRDGEPQKKKRATERGRRSQEETREPSKALAVAGEKPWAAPCIMNYPPPSHTWCQKWDSLALPPESSAHQNGCHPVGGDAGSPAPDPDGCSARVGWTGGT
ncbi:UNVERIFIED_CONTAM: hypothetical protein FKN15_026923 [Acipenser sinensis]